MRLTPVTRFSGGSVFVHAVVESDVRSWYAKRKKKGGERGCLYPKGKEVGLG